MKFFKDLLLPFLNKLASFLLGILKKIGLDLAQKFPNEILKPIQDKIVEVSKNSSLSGPEKMQVVNKFAISLLKAKGIEYSNWALDTFLQNIGYDLHLNGKV
jgi:hypothetical protein